MHSKQPGPTKAEKLRMALIVELGCVACRQFRRDWLTPMTVHHLTDCGRRRGHRFTVGLCHWHHQGYAPGGMSQKEAAKRFGPSIVKANGEETFADRYGDDDSLLRFQELLIRQALDTPGG